MRSTTRTAALKAAAKVALVTVPLGCGNVVEDGDFTGDEAPADPPIAGAPADPGTPPPPPDDLPGVDIGVVLGAVPPDPGDGEGTPVDPPVTHPGDLLASCQALGSHVGDPSAAARCCDREIEQRLMSGDWASVTTDQSLTRCCSEILAQGDPWDFSSRWVCCEINGDFSSAACAPWGPPMPLAMPEDWRPLLEVA